MTDLAASQDAPVTARSEVTTWTARRNRDAQRGLFVRIAEAQARSGRDPQEVADDLGIDVEVLGSVVRGETDLTMTELRLLSIACDVIVEYRVTPSQEDIESHARAHTHEVLRALHREIEADRPWSGRSMLVNALHWSKV